MATALVSVMPALSSPARPPRQVIRRLNIGATVGRPHDVDGQRETLVKMLSLITLQKVTGGGDGCQESRVAYCSIR